LGQIAEIARGNILKTLTLDSVTDIGDSFPYKSGCSCTSLATASFARLLSAGNDFLRGCTGLLSVNCPALTTATHWLLGGCTSIKSITLPKLAHVKDCCFRDCADLISANFPALTAIGDGYLQAYNKANNGHLHLGNDFLRGCIALKIVNLPVLRIAGHNLMEGCTSLQSMIFPSLQVVGVCCLAKCTNLESVRFPALTVVWGWLLEVDGDCNDKSKLTDLYFGSEITTWGNNEKNGGNGAADMLINRNKSETNLYLCPAEKASASGTKWRGIVWKSINSIPEVVKNW
jgi:hypothetical protein